VFVEGKRESRSGFAVLQGVVGDWQGGNMHTTITCIRLYPGIGQFPRLPESHLLWRRGALGPLVYFIFFFSSDWFGTLRIAYCEGFAGFSGMASDAWAWVLVRLGLFCAFGDWRGMPYGLRVNGPNVVKHYFSATLYAQRSSTIDGRFI
jgi:hypothetical protein